MFIENGDNNESMEPHKVEIEEVRVQVSLLLTSSQVVVPTIVEQFDNLQEQQMNDQIPYNEIVAYEPIVDEPYEVTLRRSQKQKRSVISNVIWFIYKSKNLNQVLILLRPVQDPSSFSQAKKSVNSIKMIRRYERRVKIHRS